jgi:hypothetical protein
VKKILVIPALFALLLGALLGFSTASASATCSGVTNGFIAVWKDANCGNLVEKYGEGFGWDNSFHDSIGNGEASSVDIDKANSQGSLRIRLYDDINRTGGQLVGLTNADTSDHKYWNLSNLNVNDDASSSCHDRVIGTWDPSLCQV